jgi:DNA-binding winged helix-turn-helix (wHTH) protein/pimeloyl-ACP methyl ester carboxylesterase/class 3 adenylate cyclase
VNPERPTIFRFGTFSLNSRERLLTRQGRSVPITPKALDLLTLLVENAGHMLPKEELMSRLWPDAFVEENNLSQNVSLLRRILGQQPGEEYIETVPKRGYRFSAAVKRSVPAGEPASDLASLESAPPSPAPEPFEVPATRYARSGEVNIAYQVLGSGSCDLVFVMGWVSHLESFWTEPSFARFLRRLASFSRLILFDKRGTGLSDRVPVSALPTLEQRMQDVRTVLDAVGSRRAVICGVSEGGPMSALFAATYPERTEALVMIGTYAKRIRDDHYPWGPSAAEREQFLRLIEAQWGGPIGIEERAPSMAHDSKFREWWASYLRLGASPGAAVALTRMNAEIDVRPVLASVHVPTLVIHRSGDRCLLVDEGRYVASQIPNARFVELPGEDHLPFVGDQEQMLEEIERFLRGVIREEKTERVLATILYANWLETPALVHSHDLAAQFETFLRREVEAFGGRLIDGVTQSKPAYVAAFDGPARAIRCAAALADQAARMGLGIGAALHTGECDRVSHNELRGTAIEIAAEIAAKTPLGEVLVSRTVRDLVAGSGITFHEHGLLRLGDSLGEWPLLRVERALRASQSDFSHSF